MPPAPENTAVAARAPFPASTDRLSREGVIDRVAEGQHGVVTLDQLREAGFTDKMIRGRVRSGRFAPLHRRVYRIGPRLSALASQMGAVLACGPKAVLSHRTAAALWSILPDERPGSGVDVSVLRSERAGGNPAIRTHRTGSLPPDEVTVHMAIPVTTPLRTLLDLAAIAARVGSRRLDGAPPAARRPRGPDTSVTLRELEQAVARAERAGLVTLGELQARIDRIPGRAGARLIRRIVAADGGPAMTRSEAEARLLALVRRARLPAPRLNARVDRFEVDFLWPGCGLGVEVDGFAFHGSRYGFEDDRARDAELAARGVHVVRVTWRQIRGEPEAVIGRVARALGWAEARAAASSSTGPARP